MKDGELTIVVTKIVEGGDFDHWYGELLYNEESVSQVTGPSFEEVAEGLLDYARSEGSVIDQNWFNN
jgi:hypothetical protein